MAAKFDAKKVEDPSKAVVWKAAKGASAWNPGNTFEDRDFTSACNKLWEKMMIGFNWPGTSLRVKSFSKTTMDYSILINRGKVKYIYDFSFKLEWTGKIDDKKVKGDLTMS